MRVKILIKLLFLFIFLATCIVPGGADDEEEDEEDRPKTCQKYVFDFVYGILQSILKCLGGRSTFKMNNIFELTTRASCLLKCTLQEEGVIDLETGLFDDIAAAFYFEETFDKPVRDITLPETQPCFALAQKFNPKEYWCKSYLEFTECNFKAILKGLIPYIGDCIATPTIGILFSVIKYLAPDSPELVEEARRALAVEKNPIKCFDKNCTRQYEYKKVNGSQSIILYDKDFNIISIEARKNKPKPKNISNDNSKYQDQNANNYDKSNINANFNYNYNAYSYSYNNSLGLNRNGKYGNYKS